MDVSYTSNMTPTQIVITIIIAVLVLIGEWKVFTKAGKPGWAAIIPIYNVYVLLKIVGRPWYWLLLLLIPIVNIVITIVLANDLARSFGKSVGYTLILIFFPYLGSLMLGFGSATYQGPAAQPAI